MQVLNRIRQPEYTGPNRCMPCTVVNLAIALVGSALIALVSVPAGAVVLAVSVALIALRGYLVPGTPTLTERYFPRSVLRWFGKDPASADLGDGVGSDDGDGMLDPEAMAALQAEGVLAECDTRDDLCLSDDFRDEWRDQVEAVKATDDRGGALASVLGLPADGVDLTERQGVFFAHADGEQMGQWYSEAALVAGIAAGRALDGRLDGWRDLGTERRGDILASLRLFLDWCPACDGPAAAEEETTERAGGAGCCFSTKVLRVSCQRCEATLFESHAVYEGSIPDS